MRSIVSLPDTSSASLLTVPDATAGPGELLLRVAATTINPADANVANGSIRPKFGLTGQVGLGYDVAGTVEAVGADAHGFAVGDHVAAVVTDLSRPLRTQSDLVSVAAADAAAVPAGLDLVAAATVPLNALTADQTVAALPSTTGRLLVTGAAGGVGGYAVSLAAERGWQVDGLARRDDAAFVEAAGARLVTEVEGGAYDAVIDPAGLADAAVEGLRDEGTYVGVTGPWRDDLPRGVRAEFVLIEADGRRLADLLQKSLTPGFAPRIASRHALADHAAAYAAFGEPGGRGRVVLVP